MDGVPETSVAALPANLPGNPGAGNVVVYEFSVQYPGTYLYHCHQEASIHVQMGMYGALVIYNPRDAAAATGPGMGQGGQLWGHKYDSDYIMLLSEVMPEQHLAEYNPAVPPLVLGALPFNVAHHFPSYWLINGLSFPNTIHAIMITGGGAFVWQWWINAHPGYDPLIQGSVNAKFGRGEKVLVRMINVGFEAEPMHIHGFHPKLIGMDQRAWTFGNPPGITAGQGLEMNTFAPFSGNTMELLIDFGTQKPTGNYSTQTYSRASVTGAPVLNTDPTGLPMPDPFSGIVLPAGDYISGPAVPNLYPWHNHDDQKSTNFGIYPGGQFTMVVVNP
jgi:FtsP/CotA-like multicopper oxidase with cupredoxin domain